MDFNCPGATGEMVGVEGELQFARTGMIPRGWQMATLEEELEAERGLSYKGGGLEVDNAIPMHNLNSVYEGGGINLKGCKNLNLYYLQEIWLPNFLNWQLIPE